MKLTPVQREVLMALVELYHKSGGEAVKGEDIAELIHKNPGTIRNQMQSLRSLGLVEGVPGPKGGYRPTAECYSILNYEKLEREVAVPIRIDGKPVEDVTVTGIDLITIHDPEKCRATVHALGDLKQIPVGKVVLIGPTPVNRLAIRGKVVGRDDIDNVLLIDILEMVSVPKEKVYDVATHTIKSISPEASIRDAAALFTRIGIRGAPVMDGTKAVGIITNTDIARALAEGKEDSKVKEIMSTTLITIHKDAALSTAIAVMEQNNVSRLIVIDDRGDAIGIITRRDILCRMARLLRQVSL